MEIRDYIRGVSFTTVEDLQRFYPSLPRTQIIKAMQDLAGTNSSYRFYNGRKGYPTRIQRQSYNYAYTKHNLEPDDPHDGPGIPAGCLVAFIKDKEHPELYEVTWGNYITWASRDELTIVKEKT